VVIEAGDDRPAIVEGSGSKARERTKHFLRASDQHYTQRDQRFRKSQDRNARRGVIDKPDIFFLNDVGRVERLGFCCRNLTNQTAERKKESR
jgi:hypothetical protein